MVNISFLYQCGKDNCAFEIAGLYHKGLQRALLMSLTLHSSLPQAFKTCDQNLFLHFLATLRACSCPSITRFVGDWIYGFAAVTKLHWS